MEKKANHNPDLTEGGCLKPGKPKLWKFVHHEDFHYQTGLLNREFEGNWVKLTKDGVLTVRGSHNNNRGYGWDGCTPKFNALHITWGNFDGKLYHHTNKITGKKSYAPMTYYASMVHDVIYQYKRCIPITRKEADKIFLKQLKEVNFLWSYAFYIAVRSFGWIYRGWGALKQP